MKIWIKMFLALIVGLLISFIIPDIKDNGIVISIFKFFAELSVNALLYLTLLYLFIKTFIGFIWFKSNEKSLKILKTFAVYTFFSIFIAIIISVIVMNIGFFHPSLNFNQKFDKIIEPANIGNLFLNIINKNILLIFEGPAKFLLPVLFVSFIFSFAAFYSNKKGYLFADLVESLDAIIEKIVRQILEFFPIGAIFIVSLFFKEDVFKLENFAFILKPLFGILIITAIIMTVYTVIIMFYLKENFVKYYLGILGACLIGFVTGNSASILIPLNEHMKKNIGTKKEVSNLLTSLGAVFNKTGTAIVGTVVLFSILLIYSPDILSLNFQIVLILFTFIFSLFLDGATEKSFLVLVSTILSFKPLHLEQDSYLLFMVAIPLFARIGVMLDVFCNAMIVTMVSKKHELLEKREYVEFI